MNKLDFDSWTINKTSESLKSLKGYGIPQTLSRAEDEWCERVAASIIEVRLKKKEESEEVAVQRKAKVEEEEVEEEEEPETVPTAHRVDCDLEILGEDLTDPTEGSFSSGKHKILRVGYYNPVSARNWRSTTRIKKPHTAHVQKYRPSRRHRPVPSIRLDAPIDECAPVTSRGFRESKLPPIYKEIKSVMQPALPTIDGTSTMFKSIDKQIDKAKEIWRQEEQLRRLIAGESPLPEPEPEPEPEVVVKKGIGFRKGKSREVRSPDKDPRKVKSREVSPDKGLKNGPKR